jgi:replicative DNA helicase
MFYDKESIKESLTSIMTFLKTSYRTYKTGYSLLDDNISGIESSSVMIISGPSNHAKSIFMLNICRSVMQLNESKDDNDVYIFITLEDDSALLNYM